LTDAIPWFGIVSVLTSNEGYTPSNS
jgi:hypothetical protein